MKLVKLAFDYNWGEAPGLMYRKCRALLLDTPTSTIYTHFIQYIAHIKYSQNP